MKFANEKKKGLKRSNMFRDKQIKYAHFLCEKFNTTGRSMKYAENGISAPASQLSNLSRDNCRKNPKMKTM